MRLFLRSRRAGAVLVIGVLTAVAAAAIGQVWLRIHPQASTTIPFSLLLVLLPSSLIGLANTVPPVAGEHLTRRKLSVLALSLIVVETLVMGFCWAVPLIGQDVYGPMAVVRNLCGFTGLALLSARALGHHLAWLGPFALVLITAGLSHSLSTHQARIITFYAQPHHDLTAATTGAVLLLAGLITLTTGRRAPSRHHTA